MSRLKDFLSLELTLYFGIAYTAVALPDLTVSLVAGPTRVGTGQTISLTNAIANITADPADSWQYRIYLSTNSVAPTNGTILFTSDYSSVAGLSTVTNVDTVTIPANNPTGTYYFGVHVNFDPTNTPETTKTNNLRSSTAVSLFAGPDLTVHSVAGPATAGSGQMLKLTNVLANVGVSPVVGNWSYRIYLSTNSTITTNATVLTSVGPNIDFPAQSSITNYDTILIPHDTAPGLYYFGVIADFNTLVTESNEANNARASTSVTISIGADLTVPSVTGPASANASQTVTLTNVLANSGIGMASGSWSYRIYLSTNATVTTNATVLTTLSDYVDFAALSSVTNIDSVTIPPGTTPGLYYFGVLIDCTYAIPESNESNNMHASGPVAIGTTRPDLTVTAIGYPAVAGTAQTLALTNVFANIGTGAASGWRYQVYLCTNANAATATNGTVLTTQGAFGSFEAQSLFTNIASVTLPGSLATGVYYYAVMIDFDNTVVESIETNNIRVSGPVAVGIGPDLTVLSVTAPGGAGPGVSFSVTERLANIGIGAAGNYSYRVYLSTNATVTTSDTPLTTGGDSSFPSQSSVTNTVSVTIPEGTPPGMYYLGVIIDFNNTVSEANENNNSKTSDTFPVGPIITAVSVRTNAVTVDVAGLAVADGYNIQYRSSLNGANAWETGTVFTAQQSTTNCTDIVPPSGTTRYYRIGHQ